MNSVNMNSVRRTGLRIWQSLRVLVLCGLACVAVAAQAYEVVDEALPQLATRHILR